MSLQSPLTVGQAVIKLLEQYGVDTLFGIPGVHTLDFCRGLNISNIQHIQARNEQSAGFMADGYARASGRPGVALVISGPGVTNTLTAIGQAYADSIPVLLLSADAESYSLGKGWGHLHEVPNLTGTTESLTGFSATARSPEDVPELIAKAFSFFSSERPRPVHIAIPIDILSMPVESDWKAIILPERPVVSSQNITTACELLKQAQKPLILVGGGAWRAGNEITQTAEKLGAAVVASTAGKGIIDDRHPLSLSAGRVRGEICDYVKSADVVLAVGTELSPVDNFVCDLEIEGQLIRIDIDARKMNDLYPADLALIGDASQAVEAISNGLGEDISPRQQTVEEVAALRQSFRENVNTRESRHFIALDVLRRVLPDNTVIMTDICQLAYTGAFAFDVSAPRLWNYPAGFCTLGCGLPDAIGAKIALPDTPVTCFAGDGGFMFTVQELVTAAELKLPIPIILWNNNALQQIKDDMIAREIEPVGVLGINPDFVSLAKSCHCHAISIDSEEDLSDAVTNAFNADRPTLIEINEGDSWLDS